MVLIDVFFKFSPSNSKQNSTTTFLSKPFTSVVYNVNDCFPFTLFARHVVFYIMLLLLVFLIVQTTYLP